VNYLNSDTAVWNDDAVRGALESATFWSKGLPYAKSLSGYWKFLLSPSVESVPERFYDARFDDSNWAALPGTVLQLPSAFSTCFLVEKVLVV
jgi:beta-galactosidase